MKPSILITALLSLCVAGSAFPRASRVRLAPKFHVGQTIRYQASYQSDKLTKTISRFVQPDEPQNARSALSGIIEVRVLDVRTQNAGSTVRARAIFQPLDTHAGKPGPQPSAKDSDVKSPKPANSTPPSLSLADSTRAAAAPKNFVDFTILPGGRIDQIQGLNTLPADQQQLWEEWALRFAVLAIIPGGGMKPGDKWKSQDTEKSASPIAGLFWIRESSYVDDQPCAPMQMTSAGDVLPSDAPPDICAVVLTTATLRQKSSAQDTTPADFKLHQLHTSGSATGANKIISYISLKTGLLVRATEEAQQNMAVTVAKTDGSNRVHYDVNASSHSEVVQLVPPAQNRD